MLRTRTYRQTISFLLTPKASEKLNLSHRSLHFLFGVNKIECFGVHNNNYIEHISIIKNHIYLGNRSEHPAMALQSCCSSSKQIAEKKSNCRAGVKNESKTSSGRTKFKDFLAPQLFFYLKYIFFLISNWFCSAFSG